MTDKSDVPSEPKEQSCVARGQRDEAIPREPTAGQILRVLMPLIPGVGLTLIAVGDISYTYWTHASTPAYFFVLPITIIGLLGGLMALAFWLPFLHRNEVPEVWALTRRSLLCTRRTAVYFVALIAIFSLFALVWAPVYGPLIP